MPLSRAGVSTQGWRVLHGDLPLPLAVLKDSALTHNLALLRRQSPQTQIWFLVDSIAQVEHIEAWAADQGFGEQLPVLLEVGIDGQRAGVRSTEQALALGQRIARSPCPPTGASTP